MKRWEFLILNHGLTTALCLEVLVHAACCSLVIHLGIHHVGAFSGIGGERSLVQRHVIRAELELASTWVEGHVTTVRTTSPNHVRPEPLIRILGRNIYTVPVSCIIRWCRLYFLAYTYNYTITSHGIPNIPRGT